MCPPLSLFRWEENRDGDTYVPYALHSYRSTATLYIGAPSKEIKGNVVLLPVLSIEELMGG